MQAHNKSHAQLAAKFNRDSKRVDWHDETLWFVRVKRDKAAKLVPEWEQLREVASQIKNNVLSNLHDYLLQFEKKPKPMPFIYIGLPMQTNTTRLFIPSFKSTTLPR